MAYYFGDALEEIKNIKGTVDGHLDMETLPSFAQKKVQRGIIKNNKQEYDEDGKPVMQAVIERDLGAMISILTVAVQQLTERIETLEKR